MGVQKHYVIIGNRRYGYTIRPARNVTKIICRDADFDTRIPNDEFPHVLANLPQLIERQLDELARETRQSEVLRFRVSHDEKVMIEECAQRAGYDSVSAYLRNTALQRQRPSDDTPRE